ncbi:MAG: DoxX family protein [Actinomycetales bacterium]|nr:MAG: DoxX family protein [Actinomycetales bacterium]
MSAILIIGRILFASLFIVSGYNHFKKIDAMTGYAKYKKLPAAKLGVALSGVAIIVGGLYILLGFYVDLGALMIAIFLILAAFIFHGFWSETDETAKMTESIAFFKDLALAGAALILFALVAKHSDLNFGWVISKTHLAFWK